MLRWFLRFLRRSRSTDTVPSIVSVDDGEPEDDEDPRFLRILGFVEEIADLLPPVPQPRRGDNH